MRALASTPLDSGLPDSTVATYTVGFALSDEDPGKKYLERLAVDGQGAYYNAENPAALNKALQDIVEDVSFGAESFVELSVGADRATFSNADRAYMNLFSPTDKAGWSGNLKGYMRGPDGLVDVNGNKATRNDGDVTRFAPGAQSFWSAEPDGNNVDRGGASSRLVAATRALYTAGPGDEGVALKDSAEHALDIANAALTPAMLGTDSRAERDAALAWLPAAAMGDPLHSKSVSIDYGDREVVYVMTNQGLLHAIDATETDATGGDELFAFMPKRLLRNLPVLQGGATGIDHVYGLDGGLTPWHTDADGDGTVDDGEELLLVFGMRRGGTAYYALDVTDPTSPRLDWVIDDTTAGFEELAQSWSRPALVDVRSGGTGSTLKERVLVFGGGYDADRLDGRKKRRDADGNAIYLVDRRGNRVARFAHPQMKHSIAADPTVIDSDADGLADRLYAADVGGQVWRVDFDDPTIDADTTVTRLADLGADHPLLRRAERGAEPGRRLAVPVDRGRLRRPYRSARGRHEQRLLHAARRGRGQGCTLRRPATHPSLGPLRRHERRAVLERCGRAHAGRGATDRCARLEDRSAARREVAVARRRLRGQAPGDHLSRRSGPG